MVRGSGIEGMDDMTARGFGRAAGAAVAGIAVTIAGAGAAAPAPVQAQTTQTQQHVAAAPKCSATGVRTTTRYLRQLPKVPQAKALTILRAAAICDAKTLTAIAAKDRTSLSFGLVSPAQAFAVPDDDGRYKALVLMLTRTRPVADRAFRPRTAYVWPRVSRGDNDRAAWAETVSAGLLTAKEAAQMRRMGSGYMGWRTGIDARGKWLFDIAGD